MPSQPTNPVEVFYSYAHEDEKLRDELKKHLANLRRQGVITDWYDRDISAGKEWDDEIRKHLESARVILLLISPDFMNSDYINDVELKRAMERHESGEARVIPIILRPVDWAGASFSKLEALPTDAKPVTSWHDLDEAFLDVSKGIRKAVAELSGPSSEIPTLPDIPRPPRVGFIARRDKDGYDIIERLQSELAPQKNQLVALWGPGGVGKTTLAAEAVRSLSERFSQRLVWITADARPSFAFSTLLDEIAEQLGRTDLRPLAIEPKEEALRPLIAAAPTLIVLDNLETIPPDQEILCKNFLAKRAQCPVLITTRERIEDAYLIPLAAMAPDEAAEFLKRLIAQSPDPEIYSLVDHDSILRTAEYNPLIIQWIVAQIDLSQDPEEVLSDLSQGEGDAAERVFDRSFNLKQLDNGGRTVLLALSLFAPSASRKALAQVAGLSKEKDRRRFKDAVRTLSSLWLLRAVVVGERLAVEGLTRQLTEAHLDRDPRSKLFRERYVARFLRHAEANAKTTPEDFEALEPEKENILNAIDVASKTEDWPSVMRTRSALEEFLDLRGYWEDAIRSGKQALRAAQELKYPPNIAQFGHSLGVFHQRRGELDEARRIYSENLEIEKLGQAGIASSLHNLGSLAQDQGDFDEARRLYSESLEIEKRLGNQSGIAKSLAQLAQLARDQSDLHEARRLYDESLEIMKALGNQAGISAILHNLGVLVQDQGEFDEARRLFGTSLEISKRLGNQGGIASTQHHLGSLAQDAGELDEARRLYQESLGIDQRLGNQSGIAITLHQLGEIAEEEGNNVEAARLFSEALAIFEKLKSPFAEKARQSLERVKGKS